MLRCLNKIFLNFILLGFFIHSASSQTKVDFFVPQGWVKPVYDFKKEPLTKEKIELGKMLFYDPILSEDSTISCASCHLQNTNFTHVDHDLSHGIYGRKGTRNTLSIINIAWNTSFMWDGGINHIEVQPLAPLENSAEMNSSLPKALEKINKQDLYKKLSVNAYGTSTLTGQYFLKALAQYLLTLQSYNSKYDKVMRAEKGIIFNEFELKGYQLFQKNCSSCHKEPLFTNQSFENNGLKPDDYLNDIGRMKITGKKEDSLKFRVPSLRNIEVSYPYMHDGRYKNLQMVIFHYNDNIHKTKTLAPQLQNPLNLSEDDRRALVQFLKTLTDEEFLHDAKLKPNGVGY